MGYLDNDDLKTFLDWNPDQEGDEVKIFGSNIPHEVTTKAVEELAKRIFGDDVIASDNGKRGFHRDINISIPKNRYDSVMKDAGKEAFDFLNRNGGKESYQTYGYPEFTVIAYNGSDEQNRTLRAVKILFENSRGGRDELGKDIVVHTSEFVELFKERLDLEAKSQLTDIGRIGDLLNSFPFGVGKGEDFMLIPRHLHALFRTSDAKPTPLTQTLENAGVHVDISNMAFLGQDRAWNNHNANVENLRRLSQMGVRFAGDGRFK